MSNNFDLESGTGLASVLKEGRLRVPVNQREYKWENEHVCDLLADVSNAIRDQRGSYFMGTIVLTKRSDEEWEIADGQQRLATTTILMSVIRDEFLDLNDEVRAKGVESDFLFSIDTDSSECVARLKLNTDDNHFFYNRIILRPKERPSEVRPSLRSHNLLKDAYETIQQHFRELKKHSGSQYISTLLLWRKYLLFQAKVLVLRVPDSRLAFVMFATLNDRGIEASQVDLIKNHLFAECESGQRETEAHRYWSTMRGVIESISDKDSVLMEFVRWACCMMYGITRENEMFDRIEKQSRGAYNAITMLSRLQETANDYVALFNPEHEKWSSHRTEVRTALKTLQDLDVKQMRPLLLSIARNFSEQQISLSLPKMVSWAIRLTVAGGTKAGRLDTFYAGLAHRIYTEEIKNYDDLLAATDKIIPSDSLFRGDFENLRIKVSWTARYMLRELEKAAEVQHSGAWQPSESTAALTLEHVLPRTKSPYWPEVTEQDIETHAYRLGNLALMNPAKNSEGDKFAFDVKKPLLKETPLLLTQMIADDFTTWGVKEIEVRQKKIAEYAPLAWPI